MELAQVVKAFKKNQANLIKAMLFKPTMKKMRIFSSLKSFSFIICEGS